MAGQVSGRPVAADTLHADDLPVAMRAELGFSRVPADQLAQVGRGDVLIVEHAWVHQDQSLWLGHGELGIRVRWEDRRLVVTQTLTPTDLAMTPPNDDAPAGDPLTPLAQVPVRLTFDLGERTLSLGELRQLQVGQVLELSRPLSQTVHIRANGALIGTGDLVEIDGRLGVAVASIAPPQGQTP